MGVDAFKLLYCFVCFFYSLILLKSLHDKSAFPKTVAKASPPSHILILLNEKDCP